MNIDIKDYWRDKDTFTDIMSEVNKIEKIKRCKVNRIVLPQELLYPIVLEVSAGMTEQFSMTLCGYPIDLNNTMEIGIEYYPDLDIQPKPMFMSRKEYRPFKQEFICGSQN